MNTCRLEVLGNQSVYFYQHSPAFVAVSVATKIVILFSWVPVSWLDASPKTHNSNMLFICKKMKA